MAIGSVFLPGVYDITQTSKGMTAKYMAEQSQATQGRDAFDPDTPDDGGDSESYATGTLLINGQPVQNASGERVIISEDTLTGETYRDDSYNRIVADDTQGDEEGETIWVVVDQDGNRVQNDDDQDIVLAEGGYEIATSDGGGDESDGGGDESDDTDGDSGDGPYNPIGEPSGTPADELMPEGFESISPQPIKLTVNALCTTETWEQLDDLRDQRRPFDVAIGEFAIERMGIVDLSRQITGNTAGVVNDVTVKLKQFEEVTVKVPGSPTSRSETGGTTTPSGDAVKGWIDKNNDGLDDRTNKPIPEYEEIVVDEGETRQLPGENEVIGDGEFWGNNLIDVSAPGATVQIEADGDGWVIKNVGIKGNLAGDPQDENGTGGQPTIIASVPEGGESVIENVYLGNMPEEINGSYWAGGIFVRRKSRGHLQINRVNIQNKPANGLYASAPGNR